MAAEAAPRTASAQTFLVTFALIFAAMAGLFVVDTFLAGVQQRAGRAEAAARFREGKALLAKGDAKEAAERFKAAIAVERDNRDYQLALADASRASGRPDAAVAALKPLLERDATDGAGNLSMARSLLALHRPEEAISYYHRAIYGHWPGDPIIARRTVRIELVELLAKRGARQELLAELLSMEDGGPSDTALERRRAHLFVAAGSPSRAVALFREMVHRDRSDADALAGLGDAEAAQGNYRSAQANLAAAARLRPGDPAIEEQLAQVNRVRDLDPTQRGLAPAERQRRSIILLGGAILAADRCPAIAADSAARPVLDSARSELAHPPRTGAELAAEHLLDRAEQVWALREGCLEAGAAEERAVALVLNKLAE
jgi:tetratricopeptide (TPR) repeat protein